MGESRARPATTWEPSMERSGRPLPDHAGLQAWRLQTTVRWQVPALEPLQLVGNLLCCISIELAVQRQ